MDVSRGRVTGGRLYLVGESPIRVGSPAWHRWLTVGASFSYEGVEGTFTARRAPSGEASYWRAYRKVRGRLRGVYLGRPQDVTAERLVAAAARLAPEAPAPPPADSRSEARQAGLAPLLHGSLLPPPLGTGHLIRERLFGPLRNDMCRTVLIVGPPGSGKSALVASWATVDRRAVAWLALDSDDNDPRRFLASAITALETLQPEVAVRARALLNPAQPTPPSTILNILVADLTAHALSDGQGRPAILVLDDYQVITSHRVHELVALLLHRSAPSLRLVVLSRTAISLPLGPPQPGVELAEIGAAELAFTPEEVASFLGRLPGKAFDDQVLEAVSTRTEGWAGALELLAYTAQYGPDTTVDPNGDLPGVRTLVEEALTGLTPDLRRLLLSVAVLDRFCPELCAALVGRRSIAQIARTLRTLERGGLFVQALGTDGRWYRLHRLVGEELLRELRARSPERERVLRRRAAAWYEREELVAEAVPQALAAHAWAQAARLIEQLAEPLWRQGAVVTIERWLGQLPARIVEQHPRLAVIQAWAVATQGNLGRAEVLLAAIDRGTEHDGHPADSRALALRAKIARLRGDGVQARQLGRQVLDLLGDHESDWRATALVDLAVATLLDDRPAEALDLFRTAAALAQTHQNYHTALMALFHQASTLLAMGQLTEAHAIGARAKNLALSWGVADLPVTLLANLHGALVHYERDELDHADLAIDRGLEQLGQSGNAIIEGQLQLVRSMIAAARDDGEGARAALDAAEQCYAHAGTLHQPHVAWRRQFIAAWRAVILARSGSNEGLRPWLVVPPPSEQPPITSWVYRAGWLVIARAHLVLGEPEAARIRLQELVVRAERVGAGDTQIKLLVLLARAQQQCGMVAAAEATLVRALERGEKEGYRRSILDEGEALAPLLRAIARRPGAPRVTTLLVSRLQGDAVVHVTPLEVLTPREREIAELVAAGHANAAIAARLVVSEGTVKWHISNILGKLGLRRRTEVGPQLNRLRAAQAGEAAR